MEATPPAPLQREVAVQPTPLRSRLRSISLPTILEEEEEEEEEAQVEQQPAPLRRERLRSISLPTVLEEEEEEEEQVEAQTESPAVRRPRRKREIASLLTDFGDYWKVPPTTRRRRRSRVRRKPQRYVP